jgi:uncharacterized membrane protein SpoIIM required for sporulation
MVLEGLIKPFTAEKRPYELLFLGILFSSVAIILSIFIFSPHSSIVSIALTAFVCVPIIYGVIKLEEKKSMDIEKESVLVKEHGRALLFFIFLFVGFVISFALWYVFLPQSYVSEVFSVQSATISGIESSTVGNVVRPESAIAQLFFHNVKVLLFCLLFAFFYGFGAIFILTWNASVVGVAIGDFVRTNLGAGYVSALSAGFISYMVHGIPEITAYFTAGLAGGIISIAVINHEWNSHRFKHVLLDSIDLVILSFVLLGVAAVLEVFVSPIL